MILSRIKINGQFTTIVSQDDDFYYTSDNVKIPKDKVVMHKKGYGVYKFKSSILDKIKKWSLLLVKKRKISNSKILEDNDSETVLNEVSRKSNHV